jgi:hypothetical protein
MGDILHRDRKILGSKHEEVVPEAERKGRRQERGERN